MLNLATTDTMVLGFVAMAALAIGLLVYVILRSLGAGAEEYGRRFTQQSEATLEEMFVYMPPSWILTLKLSCSAVAGLIGAAIFATLPPLQLLIPILMAAVPAFFAPDIMIKRAYANRIAKFHTQMIDGLTVLSNSMRSGLSFQDSMKMMTDEVRDPLSGEFKLVLREISLGQSQERALENLTRRIPLEDLNLFVASINAVSRMGKGIPEICERALGVIQERFRITRRIDTMTSEGRAQAFMLCSAPFALMAILYFIDPSLTGILFTTFPGAIILIAVIVLDVIGYLIIWRIINIDI